MARKDAVNAHGGEAGRHKQLYRLAHQKIMDELGINEEYMEDPNNLAAMDEIEEEASAKSREQFLACLFILMADKVKYKPIKDLLNNDFIMGKRSYPETVIEAKRLLAEFTLPDQPSRKPTAVVDDGSGLVFGETNGKKEYVKKSTCNACGKKGHLVYGCTSTSESKNKETLAMINLVTSSPPSQVL